MLSETFHSATIRDYYCDRQARAAMFLHTIGVKAIILEEQLGSDDVSISETEYGSHSAIPSAHVSGLPPIAGDSASLKDRDSFTLSFSDATGLVDEAEMRRRLLQSESLRAMRRNILEKKALTVFKRGRNHKLRLIEILVQHESQRETFVVWKSKMNTLKKVEIDQQTQVEFLPHQYIRGEGDVRMGNFPRRFRHHKQGSSLNSANSVSSDSIASGGVDISSFHNHGPSVFNLDNSFNSNSSTASIHNQLLLADMSINPLLHVKRHDSDSSLSSKSSLVAS
jgi:hypothetical protein